MPALRDDAREPAPVTAASPSCRWSPGSRKSTPDTYVAITLINVGNALRDLGGLGEARQLQQRAVLTSNGRTPPNIRTSKRRDLS